MFVISYDNKGRFRKLTFKTSRHLLEPVSWHSLLDKIRTPASATCLMPAASFASLWQARKKINVTIERKIVYTEFHEAGARYPCR